MESREDLACFAVGAAGYPLLELLWRGHTHWTMSCTGGVCLAAMRRVCKKLAGRSLALCCAACGGVITGAELAVGLLVNRLLDLLHLEDYTMSDEPQTEDLEEILAGMLDFAVEKGLIEDEDRKYVMNLLLDIMKIIHTQFCL